MTPAPLYAASSAPESTLLALAMLPPAVQYAFAVVLGLCVGSFVNVVVHRLP
ncbi:prepilin peptidase, partial [Burkholderia multivorans]|nr:prepilin peptidase [Burkholderia multivorans]